MLPLAGATAVNPMLSLCKRPINLEWLCLNWPVGETFHEAGRIGLLIGVYGRSQFWRDRHGHDKSGHDSFCGRPGMGSAADRTAVAGLNVYAAFTGGKLIGQTWKSFLKMF